MSFNKAVACRKNRTMPYKLCNAPVLPVLLAEDFVRNAKRTVGIEENRESETAVTTVHG